MTPAEQTATICKPPPRIIMKQCQCGAVYTPAEWAELPYVCLMSDGAGGVREMRNCVCQSSLTVEVPL